MDEGYKVRLWMQEQGHSLAEIARRIGYSPSGLWQALHNDKITPRLSDQLWEQFLLNVPPNTGKDSHRAHRSGPYMGRPTGPSKTLRFSKLDPFKDEIIELIKQGTKQRDIAKRYDTSDSNLHQWMKRYGLTRQQQLEEWLKRDG